MPCCSPLRSLLHIRPQCTSIPPTQDDLICLPAKLASSLGGLGPLVLVSRVTSSITLLDPLTLRTAVMDAPVYWRTPFKAMLTSRALVEYVVLDIEPLHGAGGGYGGGSSSSSGKWCLAEAQVARKSDFGRNDTVFFARTHLGNILHPGEGQGVAKNGQRHASGCGSMSARWYSMHTCWALSAWCAQLHVRRQMIRPAKCHRRRHLLTPRCPLCLSVCVLCCAMLLCPLTPAR